tara:strand:- start:10376 stop:13192 length:2817 start_codon:yes stop_codon:yes gene_type:complete
MGIFDPKIDANVSIEAAQAPSGGAGALAGLFSAGLDAYSTAQTRAVGTPPSYTQQKDQQEQAQIQGFQDSLLKSSALRRDGRMAEADRAEQQILANAARDGLDISSEMVQATYRATTGRDPKFMGVSNEQRQAEAIMESDEFKSAYVATFAGTNGSTMSDTERQNVAMAQIARQQSNNIMLQNNNIDWNAGRADAFSGVINTFNQTNLGSLSILAQQGKMIPIEQLNQSQAQWDATKSQLYAQRPQGISDAEWKPIQDQITQVDNSYDLLLKFQNSSGDRDFPAQLAQNIVAAVQTMDGITDMEKLAIAAFAKDPTKLIELNVTNPTDMKQLLEDVNVNGVNLNTFGQISDPVTNTNTKPDGTPSLFPQELRDSIGNQTASELFTTASTLSTAGGASSTSDIAADPKIRGDYIRITSKAFAAMVGVGEKGEFLSSEGINKLFNGTIVAGIDAVAKVDPASGLTLYLQGQEAINQQHAIATQALQNQIRKSPEGYSFNEDTGQVNVSLAGLSRLGMTEDNIMRLTRIADDYYNGDQLAMLTDRGSRLQAEPALSLERDLLRGPIVSGVTNEAKALNDLASNLRAIQGKRDIFNQRVESLKPKMDEGALVATDAIRALDETTFASLRNYQNVEGDAPFLAAINTVAGDLGIDNRDLFTVMGFETVGTFNPSIKNPGSTATGLIQFLESTAKGLGTSTSELANMTREQQMEYVGKYLKPFKGKMKNIGDVYMAVHWPAAVGKAGDYVMYREGSDEYKANKNLDKNGDGIVTRADVLTRLREYAGGSGGGVPQVATTSTETGLPVEPQGVSVLQGNDSPSSVRASGGGSGISAVAPSDTPAPDAVSADVPVVEPQAQPATNRGQAIADQLDLQAVANLVSTVFGSDTTESKAANGVFDKVKRGTANVAEVNSLIESTLALPRTSSRQELLADLYEVRDGLNN